MNTEKFMELKGFNADNMGHEAFYKQLIFELGKEEFYKIIELHFTDLEALANSYNSGDIHLNDCEKYDMDYFRELSGIKIEHYESIIDYYTPLIPIYRRNGIKAFSQSQGVCLLKNAILMRLQELNLIKK